MTTTQPQPIRSERTVGGPGSGVTGGTPVRGWDPGTAARGGTNSIVVWMWRLVAAASSVVLPTQAESLLDTLDKNLAYESKDGKFRADVSGLADLEGYYIDQRPPGLIFGDSSSFVNPRLAMFLDVRYGDHLYAMAQGRWDRGFDPRSSPNSARADEYLLRYTPFAEPVANVQIGKFATAFGAWVGRHDSWQNPLINAPLPYENVTVITDPRPPADLKTFLNRSRIADLKEIWVPVIWGPSYASGASVFGRVGKWDYAAEVKNASLSSRPYAWDVWEKGFNYPTVTTRLGFRPNAAWNLGASFSQGAYLTPDADPKMPLGTTRGDYLQTTFGADASFAWHRFQFWGEAVGSRFEVPGVTVCDTLSYFLEGRYKLTTRAFIALRWNQQFFGDVSDGKGRMVPWDNDAWRTDLGIGYRFSRHVQGKLQYSFYKQDAGIQQGQQLVAAQLTVKF